jgi:predicted TIM-barrel fold metal-dependent hydrolase
MEMRINAHCHIFNVQSIFTKGTKQILQDRLEGSSFFMEELHPLLLDPLEAYLEQTSGMDLGEIGNLAEEYLREAENAADKSEEKGSTRLWAGIKNKLGVATVDALLANHWDIIEFVGIALMISMDRITDYLFDDMADGQRQGVVDRGELAIVPLMMDILSEDWKDKPEKNDDEELKLYGHQIEQTLRQCIRYPGRVLPFYAVNPWRPDYLESLKEALAPGGGFVGMKVYPSLGYEVNEIEDALRFCDQNEIPVLTHCNNGGFKAKPNYGVKADPKHWEKVLDKFKDLKVCFGHFGGEEFFRPGTDDYQWGRTILEFMEKHEGRVFGDISFHTGGMGGFGSTAKYFQYLRGLLENRKYRPQILFGTDFFLVLQRISEDNYWEFFRERLNNDRLFEKITRKNPLKFLGLNAAQPGKSGENIKNHIEFLKSAQASNEDLWESGGVRANWLRLIPGFE